MTGTAAQPWHGESGLAADVVTHLAEGRDLDDLGLASVDGRVDLRGLPGSGTEVGGADAIVTLRDTGPQGLDLSGARLGNWRLHDCEIRDCLLTGADCHDWRLWATTVSDADFTGASLRGAAVGTWEGGVGNSWIRVSFRDADLRVGVCWAARFEDCDFTGADLTGTRFEQCTLLGCRFGGELNDVLFDGRGVSGRPPSPPMEAVDFTGATFGGVEFLGFDLAGVTLPDDPNLRLVHHYRCTAEHAIDLLGDSAPERVLRADLESRLRLLRAGTAGGDAAVINRRDYLRFGGEPLATLAEEVFARAEAICRDT
jgi:uncharacterized protein YjbI with pentapeptide repeats